jgi:hypothetical protein
MASICGFVDLVCGVHSQFWLRLTRWGISGLGLKSVDLPEDTVDLPVTNIKDPRLKSEAESIGAQVVGIAIST